MTDFLNRIRRRIGARLGAYLAEPRTLPAGASVTDLAPMMACLQPGDVVLVEGTSRVSVAIKYLTQSTWSHAALYAGRHANLGADAEGRPRCFLEAELRDGVHAVSVSAFENLHCRICRPVGLRPQEVDRVIGFVKARLGHQYDLKNVFDLARYLLPTPPVPVRWRRRMLSLGSGDPTRAICSTLIALAVQSVRYPILPEIESIPADDPACAACVQEILHIRHHSLFVPRDFDVSPYFDVIKPTLVHGFDHRLLRWHADAPTPVASRGGEAADLRA